MGAGPCRRLRGKRPLLGPAVYWHGTCSGAAVILSILASSAQLRFTGAAVLSLLALTRVAAAQTEAPAGSQPAAAPAPAAPVEPSPSGAEPSPGSSATNPVAEVTTPSVATEPSASQAAAAPPSAPAPLAVPAPEKKEEKKPPEAVFSGKPGDGVTVKVGDAFSLNLKSRIQLRYQFNESAPAADGSRKQEQLVNVGTLRLIIGGNILSPELTYLVQLALADRDYRDGAKSPVYDAFFDWKGHRDVSVKVGQYFVPFDRLRTIREAALQMADRSRPVSELTLDRDVGVTFYSDHFLGDKSPFAYRLGVFGGGGTNLSLGKKPGALAVARLELRPLGDLDDDKDGDLDRREKPALALGVAGAANWNTNRPRSTTGNGAAPNLVQYTGWLTDYYHLAADLVFKWQGFALQGEYVWRQASVASFQAKDASGALVVDTNGDPVLEYTRSGHGWVAQASYVFPVPVEIVGRYSRMYAFSGTDPALIKDVTNKGNEFGVGLNYYLNGHKAKFQADYIARAPEQIDFGRADHAVHVQADMTF